MREYVLSTARLGLRRWLNRDLDAFAEMNQDPEVMRYFPGTLTPEQSEQSIAAYEAHRREHGFTYWAADALESKQFIGFIGLKRQAIAGQPPFLDVGWRLQKKHWRQGLATEGALACLSYAFEQIGASEVSAIAPMLNIPSIAVMRKIGMHRKHTFMHPEIDSACPLQECVRYSIRRNRFASANAAV